MIAYDLCVCVGDWNVENNEWVEINLNFNRISPLGIFPCQIEDGDLVK